MGSPQKYESTNVRHRGGVTRSSEEDPVMGLEQRGDIVQQTSKGQPEKGRILMEKAKPFQIPKQEVWEAYKQVKANGGAAGVDGQTIEDFEADLKNNLYKIWNRMSSGSYFPPPVKRVEIPKADGGMRPLGIPTVSDRVAQTVVKRQLEPELEPQFHDDSYGYRPGKSAIEAVGVARKRCWEYDWVLDLDVRAFFDNIGHELLMRALQRHTDSAWVLLYVERWLKAPVQEEGGQSKRDKGTPQGGVVSPLLANLFLHYAFDQWMKKNHPQIPFERYADDMICHCKSREQAEELYQQLKSRFEECGLELHPVKTKIVYCKDGKRKGKHEHESFDFLGYTFRPRRSRSKSGKCFINFTPAISNRAKKRIRQTIRSWRLHLKSDKELEDLARMLNVVIQGWINYYSRFYKSELYSVLRYLDKILSRWAMRKFGSLRRHQRKAQNWIQRIAKKQPGLFAHWRLLKGTGWTIGAG
jgi:RNA-directed DNA polymerase